MVSIYLLKYNIGEAGRTGLPFLNNIPSRIASEVLMLSKLRTVQLNELLSSLKINEDIDLKLVNQALTHPSVIFEGGGSDDHNQRLEFLGDAVIGLIIAEHLYVKYPHKTEGELTKMRAAIVCEASLAEAAREIKLGRYLAMGRGEEQMGGAKRPSNLADSFESLMGALFLSLGLKKVKPLVLKYLQEKISGAARGKYGDYKTELQEYIQRCADNRLSYRIIQEEGPDHDKMFLAGVYLNDELLDTGSGHTKKEAEQQAARLALQKLGV